MPTKKMLSNDFRIKDLVTDPEFGYAIAKMSCDDFAAENIFYLSQTQLIYNVYEDIQALDEDIKKETETLSSQGLDPEQNIQIVEKKLQRNARNQEWIQAIKQLLEKTYGGILFINYFFPDTKGKSSCITPRSAKNVLLMHVVMYGYAASMTSAEVNVGNKGAIIAAYQELLQVEESLLYPIVDDEEDEQSPDQMRDQAIERLGKELMAATEEIKNIVKADVFTRFFNSAKGKDLLKLRGCENDELNRNIGTLKATVSTELMPGKQPANFGQLNKLVSRLNNLETINDDLVKKRGIYDEIEGEILRLGLIKQSLFTSSQDAAEEKIASEQENTVEEKPKAPPPPLKKMDSWTFLRRFKKTDIKFSPLGSVGDEGASSQQPQRKQSKNKSKSDKGKSDKSKRKKQFDTASSIWFSKHKGTMDFRKEKGKGAVLDELLPLSANPNVNTTDQGMLFFSMEARRSIQMGITRSAGTSPVSSSESESSSASMSRSTTPGSSPDVSREGTPMKNSPLGKLERP